MKQSNKHCQHKEHLAISWRSTTIPGMKKTGINLEEEDIQERRKELLKVALVRDAPSASSPPPPLSFHSTRPNGVSGVDSPFVGPTSFSPSSPS